MAEFFHVRRDDRSEEVLLARMANGKALSKAFRKVLDRYDRMCRTPLARYAWLQPAWVVEIAKIVADDEPRHWLGVFDTKFPSKDFLMAEKAQRGAARKALEEAATTPALGFALIDAVERASLKIARLGSGNLTEDEQAKLIVSFLKGTE